jgi:hypothetical protein
VILRVLDGEQRPAPEVTDPRSLASAAIAALGRALQEDEKAYLKQIEGLWKSFCRSGAISLWQLHPFTGDYGTTWGELNCWPAPPEDEVEFWQGLSYHLRASKAGVPAFMETVSASLPPNLGLVEFHRKREIARWKETFKQMETEPPRTAASQVEFRLVLTPSCAEVEWRFGGSPQFQPLKTRQYEQFANHHGSESLDVVPATLPIWCAIFRPWDRYTPRLEYKNPEFHTALGQLLRLNSLQPHIVGADRLPLPRPALRLKWQVDAPASPAGDYTLALRTEDGQEVPPVLTVFRGEPTLYLCASGLFEGPAPLRGLRQINFIPAAAFETIPALKLLAAVEAELPPQLTERITRVRIVPRIHCSAESDTSGMESLCVGVTCAAPNSGEALENFSPEGWRPLKQASSRSLRKGAKIELLQYEGREHFPAVIDALGLRWNPYRQGWFKSIGKKFPEQFTQWLAALAPGIEVYLHPELATLRDGVVSGRVALECEPDGVDWFNLKVVLNTSDTELTQEELNLLLKAQGRFVRLGKKGWRRLDLSLSEEDDTRLAKLGLSAKDFSPEPQRLHVLQLSNESALTLLAERQAEEIRQRVGELKARVTPDVPPAIRAELRPYQVEGFHFLAYLTENRFGGVLADDMGLGKTLQTLTWLQWLRERQTGGKCAPSLVVCPKSVMDNWRAEAGRFLPDLRVELWRGADASAFDSALEASEMMVLNYSQLRTLEKEVQRVNWHAVILDEGQYIKNPDSQTAQAARALKAEHRLVLSGTPIENRLLDLWSLMAFAMPGVLGTRAQFLRRYDAKGDTLARQRLSARVRPFVLRRTKGQVARDLPDKIEEDIFCELEGPQKKLYRAELKRAQQLLLNVQSQSELNKQRFNFLTSLLRLRQICCHPKLVSEELAKAESAKVNALFDLLEPLVEEGHKVLVFSQFVEMLATLRSAITERGWKQFYLAGETENRGELVSEFQNQEGAAVFLISLKAGGFGLNLTAASYVVLFDPWWNPAVESQAIDRTHRIGQSNKVIAYRLLIKESIEEKIRALQRKKASLVQDVLGEENFTSSLTLEDLRSLLAD